ncbi:MAG: putative Ig domain-containing protein [Bradyrhizobium sp.]
MQLKAVDPDGDTVTYSAANLPVGAKLDPVSGLLTWAPGLVQVGKYAGIVLSATDGSLTTTQTVAITVIAANEAPQFIPLQTQSGREGTQLQFVISAEDPNNDPLTYSITSGVASRGDLRSGYREAGVDAGLRTGRRLCAEVRRRRPFGFDR